MTTREELITMVEVGVKATAVELDSKVKVEVDLTVTITGKMSTLAPTTQ
jgi:hypothetical protein